MFLENFESLTVSDYALILTFILTSLIGFFVLLKNRYNFSALFFCLSLNSLSLYVISNFLIDLSNTENEATFWVSVSALAMLLFSGNLLILSSVFPYQSKKKNYKYIGIIYLAIFILGGLSFTDYIIKGTDTSVFPVSVIKGEYYYLIIFVVFIFLTSSFYMIIRRYTIVQRFQKYQIVYFLNGVLFASIITLITNVILPLFGNTEYSRIGPISMIIVAITSGYALVNTSLPDIRFLLIRVSFFILILFSYVTFFTTLNTFILNVYDSVWNVNGFLIILCFSSIGIILLKYIHDLETSILKRIDRSYRLDIFDKVNSVFNQNISLIKTVDKLEKLIQYIYQSVEVKIYLQDNNNYIRTKVNNIMSYDDLYIRKEYYNNLSIAEKQILLIMQKKKIELVIPIIFEGDHLAQICCKRKKVNTPYTKEDLQRLKSISKTLSVGISRSMLFDKVKQFNKELDSKVKEATKELTKQRNLLQDKYQQEKDMMGIMGHELRTPMTIIKSTSESLEKDLINNKLDKERLLNKIIRIRNSADKETELIETMLETSHIDNNKINIQPMPTNIIELVNYSYSAYKSQAQKKNLDLILENYKGTVPLITTDSGKLQQVINNLVSNAIKYTPKGTVTIKLNKDKKYVSISIIDTGEGIPEDEIPNLGKKFYRLNQYLSSESVVRPGGTGLGLYVVKGIIDALGYQLSINSKVGVGSTFTVEIPIFSEFDKLYKDNSSEKSTESEADMFAQLGLK